MQEVPPHSNLAAPPPCPMCGAPMREAGSCRSCGESFALTVQRRSQLPIGLLAGALAGALAGLFIAAILVIAEPPIEFHEVIFRVFLCALLGAVVGLGRAAVVRSTSRRRSKSDST
jgi:hypothetical protein